MEVGLCFRNISEAQEATNTLMNRYNTSREDISGINLTESDIANIIMQPGFDKVVEKVRNLMKNLSN